MILPRFAALHRLCTLVGTRHASSTLCLKGRYRRRRYIPLLFTLGLFLTACQAAPTRWITVAEAQQGRAPALYAFEDRLTAVWVGADAAGVHHDARQVREGELTPVTVLPLPPTHPYDQRLYPAGNDGAFYLLWLDRAGDVTALYSAWIAPDLTIQRTAPVSDGLALRYSAIPDGVGGLWVAWSGGLPSELTLYTRHIDAEGRPLDQFRVATNAEYPALIRTNDGGIYLFWVQAGQVMRAELVDGVPLVVDSITSAISLAPGDRLYDFSAALDTTHAYIFWNVTRASGEIETWFTAGGLAAPFWNAPTRLMGAGDDGTVALRWTAPAVGQLDTLAVAAESAAGLGIAELRGGDVINYDLVVPDVYLIGTPALLIRTDGSRVLAWSVPEDPRADLNLLEIAQ